MGDPYSALGVSPEADALTIRRAYQKLARRWHPALRAGDRKAESLFQAAAQAYALLSDPEQRRRWDEGRGQARRSRRAVTSHRTAALSTPDLAFSFEELVVELLPEEAPVGDDESSAEATADIASDVEVDFQEAIRGVVVSLSAQRETVCRVCGGESRHCPHCDGRGVEVGLERVRVRIPPGVGDGSRVRVRGQGNALGDRRGDLYVTIRVRPHPHFSRQGDDIHSAVPITVAEAALGAAIEVPTIRGPVAVQVPPGTRSGQRFRLLGRGVRGTENTGDHYYRVEIEPPDAARGSNRRLLEQIEQANPRRHLATEDL